MIISAAKAAEAASVLEVELNSLTSSALTSAYRNKTKECHPDHHGNAKLDQWARVSWARECLKKWLAMQPAAENPFVENGCRACNGSGRVAVTRTSGFAAPLSMVCVLCKGTGELNADEKYTPGD